MIRILYFIVILLGLNCNGVLSARAEDGAFKMSFPLSCTLGTDCWMLYYVDVNRTPDVIEDYSCGKRTYDQHKGTDVMIRDKAAMEKGIDVIAAAPGKVLRLRDSVADDFKTPEEMKAVIDAGIECGNGVFVGHEGGYATQYCHLKKGSIVVKEGDDIARGQKIGEVGISGMAEHPHLHFSVYRDKKLIDPFGGQDVEAEDCRQGDLGARLYWDDSMPLRNEAPIFLDSGFSDVMPDFDLIPQGQRGNVPELGAKAFIFWGVIYDIRQGDYVVMDIIDQEGREVVKRTISQDKSRIRQYYAAGRKIAKGMPAGTYTGRIALTRVMDDGSTQTYRHEQQITLQ